MSPARDPSKPPRRGDPVIYTWPLGPVHAPTRPRREKAAHLALPAGPTLSLPQRALLGGTPGLQRPCSDAPWRSSETIAQPNPVLQEAPCQPPEQKQPLHTASRPDPAPSSTCSSRCARATFQVPQVLEGTGGRTLWFCACRCGAGRGVGGRGAGDAPRKLVRPSAGKQTRGER